MPYFYPIDLDSTFSTIAGGQTKSFAWHLVVTGTGPAGYWVGPLTVEITFPNLTIKTASLNPGGGSITGGTSSSVTFSSDSPPLAPSYGWSGSCTVYATPGDFGNYQMTIHASAPPPLAGGGSYNTTNHFGYAITDPGGGGTAPDPPAITQITALSQTSLVITMNINSRATYTTLYRKLPADTSFAPVTSSIGGNGAGISYTNTGLSMGTTYNYRATSTNEYGTSAPSAVVNGTTLGQVAPPNVPTGIQVSPGVPPTTVAVVSFNLVPEKTVGGIVYPNTYVLSLHTAAGIPFSRGIEGATGSPIIVSGLTANTNYWFNVGAENDGGLSFNNSAEVLYRTAVDPNAPPASPSGLTAIAVAGSYTEIDLTWTDNSTNESDFYFERATNASFGSGHFVSVLSANTTSYRQTGLSPATTYYFRLRARNSIGGLSPLPGALANATTNAAPPIPHFPTAIHATKIDYSRIKIDFRPGNVSPIPNRADYYSIRQAPSAAGPFTPAQEVGRIDAKATDSTAIVYEFIDKRLSPGITYYYKVAAVNFTGEAMPSPAVFATTDQRAVGFMTSPPWTFHQDSVNMILTVLGTTIYTSDKDRWIIRTASGSWYKAGLKRPLGIAVITSPPSGAPPLEGGSLTPGDYRVYLVLLRRSDVEEARSTPSEPSAVHTVASGDNVVITLPLGVDGFVQCRDIGYDISGNEIKGADYVEVYIAEKTSTRAYLVDTLPLDPTSWEMTLGVGDYRIPTLKIHTDIFSPSNRQMELYAEQSIPPSASQIAFKGTHLEAVGESTLEPSGDDQANVATLTIARGQQFFTVSNYTLPEAAVYHELWLGGEPTGWEVWDIEGSTGYIRHGVSAISKAGFNGAAGAYKSFKFVPKNRVYFSAYFTGGWGRVFSIQGYPPLTTFRNEFAPEDNTEPNAIRSVGDEAIFFKPGRILLQRGGDEPDVPRPLVTSISSGSGCIAPKTICVDRRDNFYYLGDTGVHMANSAGVQRIIDQTGNAYLFRELFELQGIENSIGEYFSREEFAVFANLNLKGQSGGRSGFVYDTRNNAILPFTLPFAITAMREELNTNGEYQLHFGNEYGRYGILFDKGLYVDGNDYTVPASTVYGQPIRYYMRCGSLDTEHALTFTSIATRLHHVQQQTSLPMYVAIGGGNRNSSPDYFIEKRRVSFLSSDNRDVIHFGGNGPFQNGMIEFGGQTSQDTQRACVKWSDLQVSVINRGAGKS